MSLPGEKEKEVIIKEGILKSLKIKREMPFSSNLTSVSLDRKNSLQAHVNTGCLSMLMPY